MVTLTAIDEADMTAWDLNDPINGTVNTSTASNGTSPASFRRASTISPVPA